jgi:hypothetical protein
MEPNLLTGPDFPQQRDAIHVAIIPVVAGENLDPGDKVVVTEGKAYREKGDYDGVVNPFYIGTTHSGRLFWLMLKPNTVRDMKHHWVSDKFPIEKNDVTPEDSKVWLETYCKHNDCPNLNVIIEAIKGTLDSSDREYYSWGAEYDSEYLTFFGWDAHGKIPNEFWDHIENFIGEKVPYRSEYFSCSC